MAERAPGSRMRIRPMPAAAAFVGAVGVVAFVAGSAAGTMAPGSALGVTLGTAAALTLVVVMLYSARRAMPAVRALGRTQTYMQVHLWGGALFLVLFLLHTGFRLPAGGMAVVLWGLSVWVVVTGVVGLLLQRAVPRILESTASFEVHLQRIPQLVDELRERAESTAADSDARVKAFYDRRLAPAMEAPRMLWGDLLRTPTAPRRGGPEVDLLRRTLDPEAAAAVDTLQGLRAAKHELDVHFTLQRVLRGWLALHLPTAVALLGLVAVHVFFVVYF